MISGGRHDTELTQARASRPNGGQRGCENMKMRCNARGRLGKWEPAAGVRSKKKELRSRWGTKKVGRGRAYCVITASRVALRGMRRGERRASWCQERC